MNRRFDWRSRMAAAALVCSWASTAHSQTAPKPAVSDDTVILSPFTVDASKDVGFVAASSLAGGRLRTDLKDTPAAYSVLTREFIDALNVTDLTESVRWSVNGNNIPDDNRGIMFADEQNTKLSFRGVTSNQQQIDFFPAYFDFDAYSLERFDFSRGPNSILFGNGSFGGTPMGMSKQARLDKQMVELKLTDGSWDRYRFTADINEPLTKSLAVRVNLLWQDAHTWRMREYNKKKAGSVALDYEPFKGTQIRVNVDKGKFERNLAVDTLGDRVSGWDGTSTYASLLTTLPSDANARGITRYAGSSASPTLIYIPSEASLGLVNWAQAAQTLGGNANAAVPIGGQLVTGAVGNYAAGPILDAQNIPGNAFNLATKGSRFYIPGREFTTALDHPSFIQDYETVTASINQQVGEHLFLYGGFNYFNGNKRTDYTTVRGLNDVYIDINQNLPTGAANPNFLQPYDESVRYLNLTDFLAHNYRGSAAFVFNGTKYGDFSLNLEGGDNWYETPRRQYVYTVKDPTVDSRDWPVVGTIRYRYYWNDKHRPEDDLPASINLVDPLSGTTRSVTPGWVLDAARQNNTSRTVAEFKYGLAALNAHFFSGKLNVLAAFRRDSYKSTSDQSLARKSYAPGWDGSTYVYRPRPPSDYFALKYTPKDASGNPTAPSALAVNRPRDGNGNPLPQYAGDRFQDDYSTPSVQGRTNTYSAGAVYHALNWVSVFADYSETYNPPSPAIRINAGVFDPLLSKGLEAGLRFNLLSDRIIITATQYKGKQDNVAVGTGTGDGLAFGLSGLFNNIIDANVVGDQSVTGVNKRSVQEVPFVYSDTARRQVHGTEIELVANITQGWRALANIAFPTATQSDAYGDTRAYLAANETVLKQILADAGVIVGANNVAAVDNTIPVNQQSPDASLAASSWNNLQAVKANFVTGKQKLVRMDNITANLFTDYTIQSGDWKGFRFGAGVNYRGKEVIGFRGADSIVDPNNSAAAIDDPTVDAYTPVYRSSYYTVTAAFGYQLKLRHNYRLRFDLTIDNLLDADKALYYNTVMHPVNGNVSSPARQASPFQFAYINPRSWSLSATLQF